MVRIGIERDSGGLVRGFSIRGHADAATHGTDIVCAAISALSQTAILGLERRLGIQCGVVAGTGTLTCRLPAGLEETMAVRAQDLLETMCLGLGAVVATYPQRAVLADTAVGAHRRGPARAPRSAREGGERPAREGGTPRLQIAHSARGTRGGDEGDGSGVDV